MKFIHNNKELKDNRKKLRSNSTDAEIILWSRIKNKQLGGYRFRRQHSIGPYIADFYCPKLKLVIELDGCQHNLEENIAYDKERTAYLNSLNIKVIRYWNNEVLTNLNGVLEDLMNKFTPTQPPPNLGGGDASPSKIGGEATRGGGGD